MRSIYAMQRGSTEIRAEPQDLINDATQESEEGCGSDEDWISGDWWISDDPQLTLGNSLRTAIM